MRVFRPVATGNQAVLWKRSAFLCVSINVKTLIYRNICVPADLQRFTYLQERYF